VVEVDELETRKKLIDYTGFVKKRIKELFVRHLYFIASPVASHMSRFCISIWLL